MHSFSPNFLVNKFSVNELFLQLFVKLPENLWKLAPLAIEGVGLGVGEGERVRDGFFKKHFLW